MFRRPEIRRSEFRPSESGRAWVGAALLSVVGLCGCSSGSGDPDAGREPDADSLVDAGRDAGATNRDSGPDDAGRAMRDASCGADLFSDPQNCGACGRVCCSDTCRAGVCLERTLDTGAMRTSQGAGTSVTDGTYLYLAAQVSDGVTVFRVAKDGASAGAAITPSYQDAVITSVVRLDDEIFYALRSTLDNTSGRVFAVPADGSSAPTELASGLTGALGLAADVGHVFYSTDRAIVDIDRSGGGTTELATYTTKTQLRNAPTELGVDAAHVYYNVVVTTGSPTWSGSVMRVARAGGAPEVLASDIHLLTYILDQAGEYVFARTDYEFYPGSGTYPPNAAVLRIPIGGGEPVSLHAASSQSAITGLASPIRVTGSDVFYLTAFSVNRVPVEGGLFEVVHPSSGYDFSVDDQCVYVISGLPDVRVLTR